MTDVLTRLRSSEHRIVCPCLELRQAAAAEIEQLKAENERLRKQLSERLQQIEEIRQASFTWALACPHNCEACEAMYELIKGSSGHPTG